MENEIIWKIKSYLTFFNRKAIRPGLVNKTFYAFLRIQAQTSHSV